MATKKQKEELLEVLKFTPVTYKVEVYGYGGEIAMARIPRKIVDYFKTNLISLPNYATSWGEDGEVPDEFQPFPQGSWYDGDNVEHCSGAEFGGCTIQVLNEQGDIVWEQDLGWNLEDEGCEIEQYASEEIDDYVNDEQAVFVGQSVEKGTFFSGDLELSRPFDHTKFKFVYSEVADWNILGSIEYDGEYIDGNDGYSTTGKSADFKFYYLQDGNIEDWDEPTDEDYGVPALGPRPDEWEKTPEFAYNKFKPEYVGWYSCVWKNFGTSYGVLYWDGENFVEFNYGKPSVVNGVEVWQGYNWDTSSCVNRPPEPPNVICKKCKHTGDSEKMERNDDHDLICPECGSTKTDWIDYDPETAKGRKNREKYCKPWDPALALERIVPPNLDTELDRIAAENPGFPTAAELDELEQVECVQCDWKGSVEQTNDWDGQMCCPECGEPVEFIDSEEETVTQNTGWPFGPAEITPFPGSNAPAEEKTLTYWTVKPLEKKSIEEQEEYSKDGITLTRKTGWRWGEWTVATNDGQPPEFDFDSNGQLEINSCYGNNIEEVEMVETSDGCWEDYEWSALASDELKEETEAFIEEEGFYELEGQGWMHSETYMFIWGPIEITSEDGSITKVVNE